MPVNKIIKRDDDLGIGYGPSWAGIKVDTTDLTLQFNPDGTMRTAVDTSATQTLTNKTLTSPTVATGCAMGTATTWSGTPTFTAVPSFIGGTAGAVTAALLAGGGTSATPCATATADKNFVAFWTKSTATSGDSRGMYVRHYFAGAGGSGEAARLYGTVDNVTAATGGTVNGAHVSLSIQGASGKISGEANALRATLDFAATPTTIGGTVAVATFDTNIAAGPTIPANTAFLRLANVGTQKIDYAMSIVAPSTAMVATAGSGANSAGAAGGGVAAKALKITVDGVDYWIGLFSSNSN